jgi:hypothetical protein
MKNQTSISESLKRLKKEFGNIHNVKSWNYEECDCGDDGTNKCFEKLEKAIRQELLLLIESCPSEKKRGYLDYLNGSNVAGKIDGFNEHASLIESWKSGVKK